MSRGSDAEHPAVDWSSKQKFGREMKVLVQCDSCPEPRWLSATLVRSRIKSTRHVFTGRCTPHQMNSARTPRLSHPGVDWTVSERSNGLTRFRLTCVTCGIERWGTAGPINARIRAGQFSGQCLACSPHARKHTWTVLSPGRRIDPVKGYIRLSSDAIEDADRWMYDAMRGPRAHVLEHRMVMARVLGRPLLPTELVDHRDGLKTNNDPSNLRLYRRGKNDDGSGCGYGTFYDEWQRAEAALRLTQQRLAELLAA